jgi:S-DNA-T family DNA segregation ATPase FtsK/SpoIIIE
VSEEEIKRVVSYLKKQDAELLDTIDFDAPEHSSNDSIFNASIGGGDDADDELYEDAKRAVIEAGKASTSYLQRKLRIGYGRASRIMDILEENGVIGPQDGAKPREILVSGLEDNGPHESEEFDDMEDDEDTDRRYT